MVGRPGSRITPVIGILKTVFEPLLAVMDDIDGKILIAEHRRDLIREFCVVFKDENAQRIGPYSVFLS